MDLARKPKLLVIELWGLGDLAIATPFLQAACARFEITLLAKPYARELAASFFPAANVIPLIAPWTAFRHKYRLWQWPWRDLFRLRNLAGEGFAVGLSVRKDPRDHFLLRLMRVKQRLGFPRFGSGVLLTDFVTSPGLEAHRYEHWVALGRALSLDMPPRDKISAAPSQSGDLVVVHTGAGQKVRVWPLDRYGNIINQLRRQNYKVSILCDPDQLAWWRAKGEAEAEAPGNSEALLALLKHAGVFIGNDSGPGHLAALLGVPTFTLFGPQLPEWFAPLHPAAEWLSGKPCPFKPCWDACRFPTPNCIWGLDVESVWPRIEEFVAKHISQRL